MGPVTAPDTPAQIKEQLSNQMQNSQKILRSTHTYWPSASLPDGMHVYTNLMSSSNDSRQLASMLKWVREIPFPAPDPIYSAFERGDRFELVSVAAVGLMKSTLDWFGNYATQPCESSKFILVSYEAPAQIQGSLPPLQ